MMIRQQNLKKTADFLSESALYLPKGLIFPILGFIDQSRECLWHEHVACAFCKRQLPPQKGAKSKLSSKARFYFRSLSQKLSKVHFLVLQFFSRLLAKLIPASLQRGINNQFHSLLHEWKKPLEKLNKTTRRNKIVWWGVLPLILLSACVGVWGFGSILEIYLFYLGSFWGGKILNHGANMIVRHKHSEEWSFLKRTWQILCSRKKARDHFGEVFRLLKRFVVEFSSLMIIGRVGQFIGYCFQGFFAWLFLYLTTKIAAEKMPALLVNLEKGQKKNKEKGYRVNNLSWLLSYHAFRGLASNRAQKTYDKIHHRSHTHVHLRPAPTTCSRDCPRHPGRHSGYRA